MKGILFGAEHLSRAMRVPDWLRASQAILFEASIMPAFVGVFAAVDAGARFDAAWFVLILVSLVGIQAGANLFKGYFEGRDRSAPASSPGSWFAFDSGAAMGLTKDPRTVLRIGGLCFSIGVVAGIVLVILTANLLLLGFGIAGAVLAWSYSSPPLRLSYRGIGEISTFFAFGPIMTIGATVAFGGAGLGQSVPASIVLGFLAAAISFARYFPNREEDRSKEKRTPVTILGIRGATRVFYGLLLAALGFGIAWRFFGGGSFWVVFLLVFVVLILRAFRRGAERSEGYELAIALTVAAHFFVAFGLIVDFALRL